MRLNMWNTICFSTITAIRDHYKFTNDQHPVGLIAKLVRALPQYHRGHGFKSYSSLNFSGWVIFISYLRIHSSHIMCFSLVFHHLRDHYEFANEQLPVGLIAQLVWALLWYRWGPGFKSRSSLKRFRLLFYQLLKLIFFNGEGDNHFFFSFRLH